MGIDFSAAVRPWVALNFEFRGLFLCCLSCKGTSLPLPSPAYTCKLTSLGRELLALVPAQLALGGHSVNVCSVDEGWGEDRDCNFITLLPSTMSVILAHRW